VTALLSEQIPVRRVSCRVRASSLLFDDECRAAKRALRLSERAARRAGLLSDASCAAAASYRSQHHRYVTLLRQKESTFWSKRIDAQQSQPRQLWRSFNKLLHRGRTPLSSDIDASALHQFFDDKMNLGSLQPRSGVSSVSFLQSHRLRSSRWCSLCLTSTACLTVWRRGYSRRATTRLRRSCAGCAVGPSTTALFRRVCKSAYITLLLNKADLDSSYS